MADFFSNIFDSLTGQQAIPQANIMDTNALLAQTQGALSGQLPWLNSYNTQLANDLGGQQRTYLGSRYGDQFNTLQDNTTKSFLDNLNLGTSLSPELEADITRKLFETGAATGFGYSPASRGNIALQTGLQAHALGRQRRLDAANYGQNLGQSVNTFHPSQGLDAGGVAGLFQQENQDRNALAAAQEVARQENFSSLLNTGTKILGGIGGGFLGAAMGNPVGGALGGAAAGSTVFGRAGGQGQSLGILAGLFGGGFGKSNVPFGERGGFPTSQNTSYNISPSGSFTDYAKFN